MLTNTCHSQHLFADLIIDIALQSILALQVNTSPRTFFAVSWTLFALKWCHFAKKTITALVSRSTQLVFMPGIMVTLLFCRTAKTLFTFIIKTPLAKFTALSPSLTLPLVVASFGFTFIIYEARLSIRKRFERVPTPIFAFYSVIVT